MGDLYTGPSQPQEPPSPADQLRALEMEMLDVLGVFEHALRQEFVKGVMIQNTEGPAKMPCPSVTVVYPPPPLEKPDDPPAKPQSMRHQGPSLMHALREAAMVLHARMMRQHSSDGQFQAYMDEKKRASEIRASDKPRIIIPKDGAN